MCLTQGRLYQTKLYTDLTITCDGISFEVHKSVLHMQSSWFRNCLGGNFKVCRVHPLLFLLAADHILGSHTGHPRSTRR
jgi:hypothetical protein